MLVVKHKNYTLSFTKVYEFYEILNSCAGKSMPRYIQFNKKILEDILQINRTIGLPALSFFYEEKGEFFKVDGKQITKINKPLSFLSLEIQEEKKEEPGVEKVPAKRGRKKKE